MSSPSISDKMSFTCLDLLLNILIEDTKEFQKEFDTKMSFIREQENYCSKNMEELISIQDFVESMKKCLFQTELELGEFESSLLQAEQYISLLEAQSNNFSQNSQFANLITSNYRDLLVLLLSADRSAAQCNNLRKEIDLYNNLVSKHFAAPKLIITIMDYHVKALKSMDEQLNQLQCMADNVASNYDQITKQLKISSLSTKCTCDMAKVVNGKFKISDCLQHNFNVFKK
ncbi:uncharacterized protein LOC6563159 [Drosophila grimshawi]|uniref:GH18772 n=1 Tax=Drosophila grimshawi TaxID=7222 RepID=B4JG17_DROGR|nr:uncharacterized protein LOC6563159 [Drosophila grimshawi]EDV92556.1 GH18772 [Drosophila grimshawi]